MAHRRLLGRRAVVVEAIVVLAVMLAGCGDAADTTAPPEPAEPGPDRIEVAAAGDFGIEPAGVATLKAMASAEPDLVLGLGDLSYAGPGSEGDFCDLVHSTVGSDVPFEVVSGNHEDDTGGDGRIDAFAACLPDRADSTGDYGTQYYFDVGRLARFIMISPDLTIDGDYHYYGPGDDGSDSADLTWLKQAIDDARARGIEWVIVGTHKNCVSAGAYYCDVYQDLFSTLIEKRVDLVLTGHDHTYQRSKQVNAPRDGCPTVVVDQFNRECVVDDDDSYARGAGTTFVIAASGGAPLYPVHRDDPEAGYFVTAMGSNTIGNRHGFADLTISPAGLDVRFVGSTPGTFADGFRIAADPDDHKPG